MIESSRKEAQN